MSKQGQSGIEFMVIIAFALVALSPFLFNTQNITEDLVRTTRIRQADNAVQTIQSAAELINAQGKPARTTVDVVLPDGIVATSVNNTAIQMTVRTPGGNQTLYAITDFNVSGTLPQSQGTHTLQLIAEVDYVNITEA